MFQKGQTGPHKDRNAREARSCLFILLLTSTHTEQKSMEQV